MRKMLMAAAALTLLVGSAYAQGGSPYNSSGSQAGGPRGGLERAAGPSRVRGDVAPPPRGMMRRRMMRKRMMMRHHRRMMHRM